MEQVKHVEKTPVRKIDHEMCLGEINKLALNFSSDKRK